MKVKKKKKKKKKKKRLIDVKIHMLADSHAEPDLGLESLIL